jgi:hypothetical protein
MGEKEQIHVFSGLPNHPTSVYYIPRRKYIKGSYWPLEMNTVVPVKRRNADTFKYCYPTLSNSIYATAE